MSANPAKAMTMTGWNDGMPVGSLPRNSSAGAAVGPFAAALCRIGEILRAIRGTRRELPPGSGGPSEPPEERPQDGDPWDDPRDDPRDDPWSDPALWTLMMMH